MDRTDKFILTIFSIIALIVIWLTFKEYQSQKNIELIQCKVERLEQQNKVKGSSSSIKTEIRYLVITNKETFIIEDSFWNDKYNNSDIFFRLEVGKSYQFKVCGEKKSGVYDYRNILEFK